MTKTKKVTSQRELEQFIRDTFQAAGKAISFRCLSHPKRYEVKVDGKEVSFIHPEQFKAFNEALEKSGIGGKFSYKWNEKKNCPEWSYKEAVNA